MPNNFGEPGFPAFNTAFAPNGTQFIYGISQIIDTLDENLSKTVGKHQLQFGGACHERMNFRRMKRRTPFQVGPPVGSVGGAGGSASTVGGVGPATALLNPSTISTNAYSATANTGEADADLFIGGGSSTASTCNRLTNTTTTWSSTPTCKTTATWLGT